MIKYAFNSWLNGYKRVFCYSGRERRSAFGLFIIIQFLLFIALITILQNSHNQTDTMVICKLLLLSFYIISSFFTTLAYNVRRLHDANLSGWFCLLYLGFMVLTIIVSIFLTPTNTYNRYGADPRITVSKKENLIVN